MAGRSWCDRWWDWSCGALVGGTAALAFSVVVWGIGGLSLGNLFGAFVLFPLWMPLWLVILGVLWWPCLVAFFAVGMLVEAAERRWTRARPADAP